MRLHPNVKFFHCNKCKQSFSSASKNRFCCLGGWSVKKVEVMAFLNYQLSLHHAEQPTHDKRRTCRDPNTLQIKYASQDFVCYHKESVVVWMDLLIDSAFSPSSWGIDRWNSCLSTHVILRYEAWRRLLRMVEWILFPFAQNRSLVDLVIICVKQTSSWWQWPCHSPMLETSYFRSYHSHFVFHYDANNRTAKVGFYIVFSFIPSPASRCCRASCMHALLMFRQTIANAWQRGLREFKCASDLNDICVGFSVQITSPLFASLLAHSTEGIPTYVSFVVLVLLLSFAEVQTKRPLPHENMCECGRFDAAVN